MLSVLSARSACYQIRKSMAQKFHSHAKDLANWNISQTPCLMAHKTDGI